MSLKQLTFSALVALAATQALDKPPLHDNLDYCNQGLSDHLPTTSETHDEWAAGWLPQDCVNMANDAKLNPADVKAYNVHYSDCGDAWVLCRHNNAPDSIQTMIDNFGKLPVGTRNFVRHVIALPDNDHAYNAGGNIAMFGTTTSRITVFIHEAGHSLDGFGAFGVTPFNDSPRWLDEYNQDSKVPDPYAQTSQVENVAQNCVVASFDANVPGGFPSIESGWNDIHHQYATVETDARNNGNFLVPGGTCNRRLENSAPVQVGGSSRIKRAAKPNVNLSRNVEVIAPAKFDTRDVECAYHKH